VSLYGDLSFVEMTNRMEKSVVIPIETSSSRTLVFPHSCHSEERGISVPIFRPCCHSHTLVIPALLSFRGTRNLCPNCHAILCLLHSCHSRTLVIPRNEESLSQLFYFVCQCKIERHFAEISPSSR
jgi:hypothetical protein